MQFPKYTFFIGHIQESNLIYNCACAIENLSKVISTVDDNWETLIRGETLPSTVGMLARRAGQTKDNKHIQREQISFEDDRSVM